MNVAVSGATGFIGRHLVATLLSDGHSVVALTRNKDKAASLLPPGVTTVEWLSGEDSDWKRTVGGCQAIINLAGENLSSGRWTATKKEALLTSRLQGIRRIGELPGDRPRSVIQASAVGYYGPRGEEPLSEDESPGTGYLAEIAHRCEQEIRRVTGGNVRVVLLRTGIVLGRGEGLLPRLFTPVRLGFGGFPGNGKQWLSWIHIDDEVRAIKFLLDRPNLQGPFNLTAPEALRMRDFVRLGGRLLHRPVWVPLPAPLLRLMFGEMADEALLTGQNVKPTRLTEEGFVFDYPTAESALSRLFA